MTSNKRGTEAAMCIRPDGPCTWEALCVAGDGGFAEVSWASHSGAIVAALRAVNDPQHSCYLAPIVFDGDER